MTQTKLAPARAAREGAPYFCGPTVWGVSPMKPVLYRIPTLGERPMRFSAEGLPQGVTLDESTGILTGCTAEGDHAVKIIAENRLGKACMTLNLYIHPDGALRTPLLGFTSWNAIGQECSQEYMLETARRMDEMGLCDFGYRYVNIDSGWQGEYGGDPFAIQPNPKFPDMKALTDAIHAMGLKVGIYSTPMQKAWGGYEYPGCTRGPLDPAYANTFYGVGKEHRENENAAQWAEWGIDYLKYDWAPCDVPNAEKMKTALLAQNRDIPMCVTVRAGKEDAAYWSTHCCSWRDNVDSQSKWSNLYMRFTVDDWAEWTNPGHYFDQDMLETGISALFESKLTGDEQVMAYTLRVMFPSPIQISCDLTRLTELDRAILMNEEVLAVNQDALSVGAVCVCEKVTRRKDRSLATHMKEYRRPLENGDEAVAVFNIGETEEVYSVETGEKQPRDLWAKEELTREDGTVSLVLAPHTVRLLRMHD